ncbi:hypothetical protein ACPPVT_03810 [Angustibacter sp. McL0619]|uniref:hypothetical protein n=1 Tax=Angustibacter sp. McL0619 TaxID=3415676 RepID=UPI003CF5D9B6
MYQQLNLTRRLFAVILAAVAALVVSIAPLGATQSARASTGTVVCIWVNGHKYCFTVPYAIDPVYLHCPGCPQLAFRHGDIVLPEDIEIVATLGRGLSEMVNAHETGNRALRAQGLAHVRAASELAAPTGLNPSRTPAPWRAAAGHVSSSVGLYQRALTSTDAAAAAKLRSRAAAQMDATVALMESYRAG